MRALHEVDDRIFTALPHGRCVCPLTPVDAPASHCDRHGIDKTGMERLYCRVMISSFLACEPNRPTGGPGTALAGLLRDLGLRWAKSCQCDQRAAQMNAWGIDGCRERRAEIVVWLNESAAQATWRQVLSAGVSAAVIGLAINPLNPGESLLDEALKRAERQIDNG